MSQTFLDIAHEVLTQTLRPLTYQEIWQRAVELGISQRVKTTGKTPWSTLGAQLYVEVRDNEQSRFLKVGKRPARFFLVSRKDELPALQEHRESEQGPPREASGPEYLEKEIHPILTYFAYASPAFNRGRPIVTKTIRHPRSKKQGYSEWNYPDLVGFSIPLEDWASDLFAINELSERNALSFFSFELKRRLGKATYREAFFQAVSNSSWAHQGYLVAARIDEDDDLLAELERLASSFGIGIIDLRLEGDAEPAVLYPARVKETLDWETMNKLCDQNEDFRQFLQSVKIDYGARRVHRSEYDEVHKDIEGYVAHLLRRDLRPQGQRKRAARRRNPSPADELGRVRSSDAGPATGWRPRPSCATARVASGRQRPSRRAWSSCSPG